MKKLLLPILLFIPAVSQAQVHAFNFYIEPEKGDTVMVLTSTETFPCAGYGIRAYKVWSSDTLIIDIRGFRRPHPCYSSMEPAQEKLLMSGIGTKFFYIKFRWEEITGKKFEDKWKVEIIKESFNITPVISTFTRYAK